MTSPILFPNQYNLIDAKLVEMVSKYIKYHETIDSQTLLNEIDYVLAQEILKDAREWLNLFKDAEWWRDDLI